MKKYLIPFLLIILISGCSRPVREAGLALYNISDPYVETFAKQIESLAGERFSLTTHDAMNSQLLQNEFITAMIKEQKDLLIINPVDRLSVYPIIKKLKSEETPVIFFNREPLLRDLNLYEKAYYVGAKAEQSGRLQAEIVMELFGDNPGELNSKDLNGDNIIQAVILKGEIGHQDAEIRTAEVVKAFKQNGFQLEVLHTEVANWRRGEAYEKMEQILQLYGDRIEVLISNNDAMALGAIDRLLNDGIFDTETGSSFPVVGIDGLDEAVEYIKRGYLYATVLNDSETQAEAIVDLAECLLKGKDPDGLTYPLVGGKYIWIDYKAFKDE